MQTARLTLNGSPLEFVTESKYLGVVLCGGKTLSFSALGTIRSFHRAANSILYSRVKPDKMILMKLLYAQCIPIVTYASAVKECSSSEMYRCHVSINNAIRKIYSFATWESIRHIRINNGFKSVYELFALAKKKFLTNARKSSNTVICHLINILDAEEEL